MTAPTLPLDGLGWDDSWRELSSACAIDGLPGRVTRVDRGVCTVLTVDGPVRASLGGAVLDEVAADARRAPCTGDWCLLRRWPDGPLTIEAVLPRRTAVIRAEASGTSRGQVLAANVDVVAVVVGLHPEPNLGRVERLLALARASGALPVVVLTKADLVGDAPQVAEDVRAAAPGVEVICTSTATGEGIDVLRALIGNRSTLALLGASGHGKSSLVNALMGSDVLATLAIRDDGKGRHTTVRRELLVLPGGGCVIDTPGLRGVGLQDAAAGLAATFPDVESLAESCRFSDCHHDAEPGCAVLAAVADGKLSVRRLESWARLQRELAWMTARSDARLRSEHVHVWKRQTKQQRRSRRSQP